MPAPTSLSRQQEKQGGSRGRQGRQGLVCVGFRSYSQVPAVPALFSSERCCSAPLRRGSWRCAERLPRSAAATVRKRRPAAQRGRSAARRDAAAARPLAGETGGENGVQRLGQPCRPHLPLSRSLSGKSRFPGAGAVPGVLYRISRRCYSRLCLDVWMLSPFAGDSGPGGTTGDINTSRWEQRVKGEGGSVWVEEEQRFYL